MKRRKMYEALNEAEVEVRFWNKVILILSIAAVIVTAAMILSRFICQE